MQQERAREYEDGDRTPDHRTKPTGNGPKEYHPLQCERFVPEHRHQHDGQKQHTADPGDRGEGMEPTSAGPSSPLPIH
jgi:hypothetical protein